MTLLQDTLTRIAPQDSTFRAKAKERLEQLTMPHWALGRLMDLAVDLAGITSSMNPPIDNRVIVTMAGDHGVVAEGVSKYPQEVTPQMVLNFLHGGAGINALARTAGARVLVVDMGVAGEIDQTVSTKDFLSRPVAKGTANMAIGPAMSREQAIRSLETGIEIARDLGSSCDLFGTGEMGIGNTTPSSAIVATFTGESVSSVTGRGTGIDDDQFLHKVSVVEKALKANEPDKADALDVLAKVGDSKSVAWLD